jgi:hypothetical protein
MPWVHILGDERLGHGCRIHWKHEPKLGALAYLGRNLYLSAHLLTKLLTDRETNLGRFLFVDFLSLKVHVLECFEVTFKQMEDIWKLFCSYTDSGVLNLEPDEFLANLSWRKLLFFGQWGSLYHNALNLKPNESLLCKLLSVQQNVNDDSYQSVLVTDHFLRQFRFKLCHEVDLLVLHLRDHDAQHLVKNLLEVESLVIDLQRITLDLLIILK